MYVFRRTKYRTTLTEMTPAEFKEALESDLKTKLDPENRVIHERTTPEQARKWVRTGGHHETPLWVDMDGKVRYARGSPER